MMARRSWLFLGVAVAWLGALTGCGSGLSLYQEGIQALHERQYQQAIELFSEELEEHPDSALALANRADAFLEIEQPERAIADYSAAIELLERRNAPNPWFYTRRGMAYYELGRYREARDDWARALELERERREKGIKVRHSAVYVELSETRDTLLYDAERQAARVPTHPTAQPVTPAPVEPSPQTPPPAELTEAPTGESTESATAPAAPATAQAEARPESTVEARAESSTETPTTAAAEAQAGTETGSAAGVHAQEMAVAAQQALAAAQAAHEQARRLQAEREAQRRAEEQAQARAEAERARAQAAEQALAAARQRHEAAAKEFAARPERIVPAANLTGRWVRDDDYLFSLVDDGARVVGEMVATDDFVYYEVTLQWTSPTTLTGFAVFQENLSACRFETSTAWSVELQPDGSLAAKTEEVGWGPDCRETDRTWGEHRFERVD